MQLEEVLSLAPVIRKILLVVSSSRSSITALTLLFTLLAWYVVRDLDFQRSVPTPLPPAFLIYAHFILAGTLVINDCTEVVALPKSEFRIPCWQNELYVGDHFVQRRGQLQSPLRLCAFRSLLLCFALRQSPYGNP